MAKKPKKQKARQQKSKKHRKTSGGGGGSTSSAKGTMSGMRSGFKGFGGFLGLGKKTEGKRSATSRIIDVLLWVAVAVAAAYFVSTQCT